jgi:DNA-binding NarL/FixJ family response regulator
MKAMKTLRVLIADDHRLMLAATTRAISGSAGLEVVSETSVGSNVMAAVAESQPDIVLLDLRMPELDGLQCLARLREQDPEICVILLSSYTDRAHIEAAEAGGAAAYIAKTIDPTELAGAVRASFETDTFCVWGLGGDEEHSIEGISEREAMVLSALGRGLSNREIGKELWITEQTVKFHLRNLYRKLGVSNRTEAARFAYRSPLDDGSG